jgi:hypothetical protein
MRKRLVQEALFGVTLLWALARPNDFPPLRRRPGNLGAFRLPILVTMIFCVRSCPTKAMS